MLVFGALAEVPLAELPLLPVPGAPAVTGGGGKRRKMPVRPLREIEAEARVTPQIAEQAATASAPVPKQAPTLPVGPWQSPQILPATAEPAKVVPFPRPVRGRARIREEDDAVVAAAGATAAAHAYLNEDNDTTTAAAAVTAGLQANLREDHDTSRAEANALARLHGNIAEENDLAASHVTTAHVDQDEEDAIALLLDGID